MISLLQMKCAGPDSTWIRAGVITASGHSFTRLYPHPAIFPIRRKTFRHFRYAAFDIAAIFRHRKLHGPDSMRERASDRSLSRSRAPRLREQPAIFFDLYDDILGVADYRMHARCNTDCTG
ncbi:hypothetical protein ACV22V_00450 [Burkholderia sp. AW33-5]